MNKAEEKTYKKITRVFAELADFINSNWGVLDDHALLVSRLLCLDLGHSLPVGMSGEGFPGFCNGNRKLSARLKGFVAGYGKLLPKGLRAELLALSREFECPESTSSRSKRGTKKGGRQV